MSWKNVQYENGKFKTGEGGGGGSSTFADLDDVNFSNLQNGQVPKYNSSTQKWENANESGSGNITDVTLDGQSVVNGQGVAELSTPDINDLGKVSISNPTDGQVLKYKASANKWENADDESGGTVTDVQVDGQSVVNAQGVAEITMPTPPTPDYPVTDVKVNGTSVVSNKEAQIKSYKEVTLAEYQTLPSSKLSDGILYAIKDTGGADGFPPLIYSDEEREVGVWRDGKPLYQKTIYYGQSIPASTDNFGISCGISNVVDKVVYLTVIAKMGNEYKLLPQPVYTTNAQYPEWSINMQGYDKSNDKVRIDTGMYTALDECYVTLRYTKTTDTPGSSIWTPFDVVNHKVLNAYGQIVKSSNTSVAAIGWATVNLSGNLAEIDFSFKGTVGGGTSSDFEWGLSVDQLRLLNPNIPNLKPVQGGNFFSTQSNQSELVGYGAIMSPTVPSCKYWLPARIYTTSGDVGGWPSVNLHVGGYWFGRCYAEILR